MLKWIAGTTSLILLAAMILGTVSISVPINAQEHNDCVAYAKANHRDNNTCKDEETLWERGLSDPIAYETMWLALFTWALASVGTIGGLLSYEQIRLARDEFKATHRPVIVARRFEWNVIPDPSSGEYSVHFSVHNKGVSAATLIEIRSRLVFFARQSDVPPQNIDLTVSPSSERIIGGRAFPAHTVDTFDWNSPHMALIRDGVANIFCIGEIRYRDDIPVERRTGFCRRWDFSTLRWHRVEDDTYEYED